MLISPAYAQAAAPAGGISDEDDGGGSGLPESGEPEPVLVPVNPLAHPSVLVQVLENMDSFMGVDGRIYTLAKGDIVTLPERNAAVLSERNIVLNINLCK